MSRAFPLSYLSFRPFHLFELLPQLATFHSPLGVDGMGEERFSHHLGQIKERPDVRSGQERARPSGKVEAHFAPNERVIVRYVLVFKIRLDLQSTRLVDRDLKFRHPIILNPEFILNIGWR